MRLRPSWRAWHPWQKHQQVHQRRALHCKVRETCSFLYLVGFSILPHFLLQMLWTSQNQQLSKLLNYQGNNFPTSNLYEQYRSRGDVLLLKLVARIINGLALVQDHKHQRHSRMLLRWSLAQILCNNCLLHQVFHFWQQYPDLHRVFWGHLGD